MKEIIDLIKLLVPLILEIIRLLSKAPKQALDNVRKEREIVKDR